ncbi:MAG: FtsH protease activity modulator HflK [Clostridia bacterium]|nr:FtsH protease activity modulator HflK [Clostridia bacterium]
MKKKSIEAFEVFLTSAIRYFKWFVAAAVVVILLTGVYKVDTGEVAVVLRFGALTGSSASEQIKQPGLHFSLPNFIDEVVKIPVEKVQELTVTTLNGTGDTVGGNIRKKGYVITGDSNILLLKMAVKYKVSDPIAYALHISDAQGMLTGVITGEMSTLAAKTGVDEMLTSEKNTICSRTMQNAQEILDRLGLGVTVTNIELTGIVPPPEAVEAFDNATTASVRKQTLIQQANDYRESALPKAESDARKLIDDAKANQSSAVAKATAIAEQFNGLSAQYAANPAVVRNGVFRKRLAALIAQSGKTVVIPDGESGAPKVVLP